MNRRTFLTALIAAPVVAHARPVAAGGWSVIRLAEPVLPVFAGAPVTIRFYNYPHDMKDHVLAGLAVSISLKNRKTEEITRFSSPARETDDPLYEMELLIDEPGAYKWSIQAEPFSATALPTLHVFEPGSEPATLAPVVSSGEVTAEVTITQEAFGPKQVTIATGEAVRWTNNDHMAHQVAWQDLQLDDSALIESGEFLTMTFDTPGTYFYFCGPHPWMTGEVVVARM